MATDARIDPAIAREVWAKQRRLLSIILLIMLSLLTVNIGLAFLIAADVILQRPWVLAPSLLGAAGGVTGLVLLGRGRFVVPAVVALAGFLTADIWDFVRGGLQGNETSLLMFIVPMILAGLLFSRVAIYLTAGLSLAAVLSVYLYEISQSQEAAGAAFAVILFALILVLLAFFFDRFGAALQGALVGQAAVSAENARLYQEARAINETLERRVDERTAELQALNEELEAFSYSVSHDLRTPLRGIDGFSLALLEDYGDKLDEEGMEYLRRIRAGTQRMSRLIDDLLALARISRLEIAPGRVDLSALAKDVVADLRAREPERQVVVKVAEGLWARGDAGLLRIALENLLGNALKFTAGRPNACIEVGWSEERGAFVVRDNGAGFDMAYAHKLFVPFQRLHSADRYEGSGIGLATTRRIIERHGGQIRAEGEVGKGAAFYFTLPTAG
ncbi:MAG TPA: ATP-binding protein [Trueperaceae bacterium]